MRTTNRLIATATALVAIGAVLAGCTSPVAPDVGFSAEKLTISLPTMVVGQAVSATLPEAMGGEEGLVYSLSPAVPGLTFDPATRVLSGTPTMPGRYDMTYTAKDSATGGTMESVTFTIAVAARPLTNQERILGTWQSGMNNWSEDDGSEGIWVDFLTFTKTRFILVRSHFLLDGSLDYTWSHFGTWEITDQEIIRIWYHNDDDVDETPDVLARFPKSYFFSGDGLFVHHWADENVEDIANNYDRMTRFVDASLSHPPLGVWVREQYDDDWFEIDTMTIESDGTFTWSVQEPGGTFTLMAEWGLDLDNYFINLRSATATWTPTGGVPEPDVESNIHAAEFLRVSYAPMMSESGERMLRVSRWDNELEAPHGEYWREMKLQQ